MAMSQAIETFLDGQRYSMLYHRRAYTAREEAANAQVPGTQWAKTIACFADDRPILVVLPASSRLDIKRLRAISCAKHVSLASEHEFGRMFPDCERGAVPPLGPIYGYRVFVDRSLADNDLIAFTAGSHREAIELKYDDFVRIVQPTVGDFAITRELTESR